MIRLIQRGFAASPAVLLTYAVVVDVGVETVRFQEREELIEEPRRAAPAGRQ